MNKLRIVFMGTPFFALPALRLLCENGYTPVAVYTQPDKVNGRGGRVSFSPVKTYALDAGISVYQPVSFKDPAAIAELADLAPDLIVVIAYGQILPQNVLDLPRYGAVNIHASMLPRYRGAAPVQRAIIDREPETGVTIMKLDAGMDTGDMILQKKILLDDQVTAGELLETLGEMGARALIRILPNLPEALAGAVPQQESLATYAAKLTKEMGHIHWEKSAVDLHALARGMYPNPGTYTMFRGKRIKLHETVLSHCMVSDAAPGEICSIEGGILYVATGEGILGITSLQPENKKRMKAADFINGFQVKVHDRFED